MPRYSGEPQDSCPHIDDIIDYFETVREINQTLREDNRSMEAEIEVLKTQNDILEDRIFTLEAELKEATQCTLSET